MKAKILGELVSDILDAHGTLPRSEIVRYARILDPEVIILIVVEPVVIFVFTDGSKVSY